MNNTQYWYNRALTALFSLWDERSHQAWRASNEFSSRKRYFPTATFHAIAAFGECGVWDEKAKLNKGTLSTPYFDVTNIESISSPKDVFLAITKLSGSNNVPGKKLLGKWVDNVINQSSHSQILNFQKIIVVSGLFQALRVLVASGALDDNRTNRDIIIRKRFIFGLRVATKHLIDLIKRNGEITPNMWLSDNSDVSPNLLLHLTIAINERDKLIHELSRRHIRTSSNADPDIKVVKRSLLNYFQKEVDRLMARRYVPADAHYDPTSLTFAMHGYVLLDPSVRRTAFFRACAEAVVDGQNPDGCWPDGISITYLPNGNVIQQPSVEIALRLGEAIFHPSILIDHNTDDIELIKIGMKALVKTANYLKATYTQNWVISENDNSTRLFSGWVSDRVRRPGINETWITAMAVRVLNLLWLAERAATRAEILTKYGVEPPLFANTTTGKGVIISSNLQEPNKIDWLWNERIIETDSVTCPAKTLFTKVLYPIMKQQAQGAYILHPIENGVSFIIYGPPGSGKTYLIKTLADVMGWPLLTLNPGHFIHRGLEFIEATSAEIFKDLMSLDHTIVFFDECDELFRDRNGEASQGRNILSFATASMLPKLQDLHDRKGVIFFLGTNYLSHVDSAIRRPGRFDGILLYDRPDHSARKKVIKDQWKKETGISLDNSRLESMVIQTAGWMIKEIHQFIKLAIRGEEDRIEGNIADYVEWCATIGKEDISASGINDEMKNKILNRWARLPGYEIGSSRSG